MKDDPRDVSRMTYSDNQFRHKIVGHMLLLHTCRIGNIGVRYSGIGGTRFSLLSGVNSNADFVTTNDLAYVFDPRMPQHSKP